MLALRRLLRYRVFLCVFCVGFTSIDPLDDRWMALDFYRFLRLEPPAGSGKTPLQVPEGGDALLSDPPAPCQAEVPCPHDLEGAPEPS